MAMELAATRFLALAHRDLAFYEYAGEFCKLPAATLLDDAILNQLLWLRANYHSSMDLPDTTGTSWREGVFWCLRKCPVLSQNIISDSVPCIVCFPPFCDHIWSSCTCLVLIVRLLVSSRVSYLVYSLLALVLKPCVYLSLASALECHSVFPAFPMCLEQ